MFWYYLLKAVGSVPKVPVLKDHGGDEGPQVEGSTQPAGDDLNPDGAFVGRELLNVGRARTEIGEEMIEILRKTAYNAEHPTFFKNHAYLLYKIEKLISQF